MPKKTKAIKVSDNEKAWNRKKKEKTPYQQANTIPLKKSFLIICEGENTEPLYFASFPVVTAQIKAIGMGASKTYLVEASIELAKDKKYKDFEVWCVFDLDIKPDNGTLTTDFNNAIELANRHNIKVAYSNDSFELWFLLHYQYIDTQLTRHEYYGILSKIWGINYEKEGKKRDFCKENYNRLLTAPASQVEAISRAERLAETFNEQIYSEKNPCTTVFELVKALNEYIH